MVRDRKDPMKQVQALKLGYFRIYTACFEQIIIRQQMLILRSIYLQSYWVLDDKTQHLLKGVLCSVFKKLKFVADCSL